jgi:mono/diheme cytochrome c family protein
VSKAVRSILGGRGGIAGWLWLAMPLCAVEAAPEPKPKGASSIVTAVRGQSWLKHLGLPRDRTAMGQMGSAGRRPSSVSASAWGESSIPETLNKSFTLTGADLYRLSCQSCHNVGGLGSPPEIRSLIDPVRATPAPFAPALRARLQKGGEKMPPFPHLRGAEVEALLSYSRSLAGLPGPSAKQARIAEPVVRVGELLVKGTCFICHDATGPGSDAMSSAAEIIPSLASFLEQKSVAAVVHKVREGAPVPGLVGGRGEMPVFSYFTAEEVSAAYIYLMTYPPRP